MSALIESNAPMCQDDHVHFVAFADIVTKLFPSLEDHREHIKVIVRAWTMTIHAHSKTHKLDAVRQLTRMTRGDFCHRFRSYTSSFRWKLPSSIVTGGHIDLYREFCVNGYKSGKYKGNESGLEKRLSNFSRRFQTVRTFLEAKEALRTSKVWMVNGNLFGMFTVTMFKMLGFYPADDEYLQWLPNTFTKTSGSVALARRMLSIEDNNIVRQYFMSFAKENGMSALTYENMLCKLKVFYFDENGYNVEEV